MGRVRGLQRPLSTLQLNDLRTSSSWMRSWEDIETHPPYSSLSTPCSSRYAHFSIKILQSDISQTDRAVLVIADNPIKAQQRGAESSPDSDTHRYVMVFVHVPKCTITGWKICITDAAVILLLSLLYLLFCFIVLHDIA